MTLTIEHGIVAVFLFCAMFQMQQWSRYGIAACKLDLRYIDALCVISTQFAKPALQCSDVSMSPKHDLLDWTVA